MPRVPRRPRPRCTQVHSRHDLMTERERERETQRERERDRSFCKLPLPWQLLSRFLQLCELLRTGVDDRRCACDFSGGFQPVASGLQPAASSCRRCKHQAHKHNLSAQWHGLLRRQRDTACQLLASSQCEFATFKSFNEAPLHCALCTGGGSEPPNWLPGFQTDYK